MNMTKSSVALFLSWNILMKHLLVLLLILPKLLLQDEANKVTFCFPASHTTLWSVCVGEEA